MKDDIQSKLSKDELESKLQSLSDSQRDNFIQKVSELGVKSKSLNTLLRKQRFLSMITAIFSLVICLLITLKVIPGYFIICNFAALIYCIQSHKYVDKLLIESKAISKEIINAFAEIGIKEQ